MGNMPVYSLREALEARGVLGIAVEENAEMAISSFMSQFGGTPDVSSSEDLARFAAFLVDYLVSDENVVFYPTPDPVHEALSAASKKVALREG